MVEKFYNMKVGVEDYLPQLIATTHLDISLLGLLSVLLEH